MSACDSPCRWTCHRDGSLTSPGVRRQEVSSNFTKNDRSADVEAVCCRLGGEAAAVGRLLGHHSRRPQAGPHLVQRASRRRRQLILQPAQPDQVRLLCSKPRSFQAGCWMDCLHYEVAALSACCRAGGPELLAWSAGSCMSLVILSSSSWTAGMMRRTWSSCARCGADIHIFSQESRALAPRR